jgi:hypothetical protein
VRPYQGVAWEVDLGTKLSTSLQLTDMRADSCNESMIMTE